MLEPSHLKENIYIDNNVKKVCFEVIQLILQTSPCCVERLETLERSTQSACKKTRLIKP